MGVLPLDERVVHVFHGRPSRTQAWTRTHAGCPRRRRLPCRPPSRRRTGPVRQPTPRWVSRICPTFMREGTPSGLRIASTGVPSSRTACPCWWRSRPCCRGGPRACRPGGCCAVGRDRAGGSPASRSQHRVDVFVVDRRAALRMPRTFSEVSRTSRAFSLKIAPISFSSAVNSVSPSGVTLPTSRSPEIAWPPRARCHGRRGCAATPPSDWGCRR